MARAQLVTLSFLIGAALGAAVVLFIPSPRETALEGRVSDLESELAAARREVNDAESVALRERERKDDAEEEVARLRQALGTAPAVGSGAGDGAPGMGDTGASGAGTDAPGHAGMGELGGRAASGGVEPKDWDDPRLRMEIQRLSMAGRRMGSSRLLGACVEAARAQGDSALALLIDVMRRTALPENVRRAATLILERLGDERAVHSLLNAWDGATTFDEQRMLLRALANLPGAEQGQVFVTVWSDRGADQRLRLIAVHALARRGHGIARRVVRGEADGVQAAIRARAIESLHLFVRRDDYAATQMIPDFGKALVTADGEGQQRLALLALEGFWVAECVAPLRAYVARDDIQAELRERASGWADAIEAGDPRPARAGQPKTRRLPESNADPEAGADHGHDHGPEPGPEQGTGTDDAEK